ncbi:hypothetical protein OAK81_00980 [Verrucomicrobiales bacterium]|nr:hypothetical protein [Verrucomicrobiales bacterium]MDC0275323.1 hypothetical protein [Verrucomicrobiales bacterium]MDC0291845.1 hypothetical protein [Verrucomicrobiales bacterium]
MKQIFSIFAIVALVTLTFAPYTHAGEVKKQPLKIEQAVELYKKQAQDFEEVKHTEAGLQNGYGLLGLGLAVLAGYVIKEQLDDSNDDD